MRQRLTVPGRAPSQPLKLRSLPSSSSSSFPGPSVTRRSLCPALPVFGRAAVASVRPPARLNGLIYSICSTSGPTVAGSVCVDKFRSGRIPPSCRHPPTGPDRAGPTGPDRTGRLPVLLPPLRTPVRRRHLPRRETGVLLNLRRVDGTSCDDCLMPD